MTQTIKLWLYGEPGVGKSWNWNQLMAEFRMHTHFRMLTGADDE